MPFEVDRSSLDSGVEILALSGTMTMGGQLQRLEALIEQLAKYQQSRIVIDMSGITYLDSSAIGVLVACHTLVKSAGGQLRLAGLATRVGSIFRMTGVNTILASNKTREEAVAAFTPDS